MARPTFIPTDFDRNNVGLLSACGFSHKFIAGMIKNPSTKMAIDEKTLRRAFREELSDGMASANAMVVQSLFKKATGAGPQSVTAAIFWLKCRAGWKPVEGVELTGKDGVPLENLKPMTAPELEAVLRKIKNEV